MLSKLPSTSAPLWVVFQNTPCPSLPNGERLQRIYFERKGKKILHLNSLLTPWMLKYEWFEEILLVHRTANSPFSFCIRPFPHVHCPASPSSRSSMCLFGISLELKLFEEMLKALWPCFKSSSESGWGHPESTMFNFHSTSALYLPPQAGGCVEGALTVDKSLVSLLSEVVISVLSIWTVIL